MQELMDRVQRDWDQLNNAQEIEIIKKHSAIGKFMTLVCTCKQYIE